MASPIRTMFVGLLLTVMFLYGFFAFYGGYAIANNLPINATLSNQYHLIIGNASGYGGVLGPVAQVQGTISNNQQSVSNPNLLSVIINSIGLAANFFQSIPALFNAIALFAAIPLTAIGIPASFAFGISQILLVGLMVLGIISAIFLFPV